MNYLLCLSIMFLCLSVHKPHRFEWLTMCVVMFLSWVNVVFYVPTDDALYWNRAIIVTLAGLMLVWRCSILSIYNAVILFMTLVAYCALAFDVSQSKHILIYDNYEGVIYGILAFQLISIFPTLRAIYHNFDSNSGAWLVNLPGDKRA